MNLTSAQKIFGYFDKSQLINLFHLIFEGKETEVLNIYREIYNQGVEPKTFINDFLELLYYFKNIESLNIDGTNFLLNDEEFDEIKKISKKVKNETLLLFWQFTIKTLEELDIVSNQNLSMEMFLIRLIYLKDIKNRPDTIHEDSLETNENITQTSLSQKKDSKDFFEVKNKIETIGQMKNFAQEKDLTLKDKKEVETQTNLINSFDDLLKICTLKKEIKLKYELEKNVNLVSFEKQRIEISFNEDLDKDFIKDLSLKLYEWTKDRWIITLSKTKGQPSNKEKEIILKKELIEDIKNSLIYHNVLEQFPDAELIDVKTNEKEKKMTDFTKILDKAKELESKMKESQQKIKNIQAEGTSGSNSIKVTLNGENEMIKIDLSDEVIKEDKGIIEDLIVAAHNNAKSELKSKTSEEISKSTSGFGIPGFKWPL